MSSSGSNNSIVPTRLTMAAVIFCWLTIFSGCALFPDVRHKPALINPFPQIKSVAIIPFANQSEDPTLSGERVAAAYLNELQAIRGFEVLPIGVVKVKMQEYPHRLATGEDFQAFARYLGVDVVMVGAITDYSAYYPPRMGMKVSWYAANPGFHPIQPGYGLPWGTKGEKEIPKWVHYEAQRALAAEQLKTQTPDLQVPVPIMPEDRTAPIEGVEIDETIPSLAGPQLPKDWPDPRGFIPDSPDASKPPMRPQSDPIISHMRNFNGNDEDFTQQLADYFYFRDDARFGGWQGYLQRSEDFIRFCCYLHLSETLVARGGQDKSRLILRWPIDRYTR